MKQRALFRLSVLIAFFSVLTFQGCAPVYVPNAYHVHQLDDSGDFSGGIYTGTNGLDVQAAYALNNSVFVLGAGSFGNSDYSSEDSYQSHRYAEGGVGYFKPFNKFGRFELLGGLGFGSSEASSKYFFFEPNEVTAKGNYSRVFIQANNGMERKHFDIGMALRLAHVSFGEFETTSSVYEGSNSSVFFEPMLYVNVGWEKVKFVTQVGISDPLIDDLSFGYEPLFFSIGLKGNFRSK